MSNSKKLIPHTLRRLRGPRSQAEMARIYGIPQQSYNRYESGSIVPKHEALLKIATHFRVTVDELLSGETPAMEQTDCIREKPDNYAARLGPELTRKTVVEYAHVALSECEQRGLSGQLETLMLHVSRLADPDQATWHAEQAKAIIDDILKRKQP